MKKERISPDPWHMGFAQNGDRIIISASGATVASKMSRADARLMLAAPRLLSLVLKYHSYDDKNHRHIFPNCDDCDLIDFILVD